MRNAATGKSQSSSGVTRRHLRSTDCMYHTFVRCSTFVARGCLCFCSCRCLEFKIILGHQSSFDLTWKLKLQLRRNPACPLHRVGIHALPLNPLAQKLSAVDVFPRVYLLL